MTLAKLKKTLRMPWWLMLPLLVLLFAAVWNFYRIDRASQALIDGGKSEQLYWNVAQLHIELEKTRAELIGYSAAPQSLPAVKQQYQLLLSRYQVFEAPDTVLVHRQLKGVAGFDELKAALSPLLKANDWQHMTPQAARKMVSRIDALRPVLANFAVQSREAEVAARMARTRALSSQRSQMLALQLVLCGGICGILLMLMRFQEVKTLAEARQALLDQERDAHRATVALELDRTTFLGALGHEIRSPLQSMQMCMELVEPAVLPEPAAHMVMMDEIRLRQIVGNLVSNAIRYTDQGEVKIRARGLRSEEQLELWLEVSDTGIGIAEEDRQRIFQPFSQGRNRRPGSSGLGLSIVKELVRLFGGHIEMDSEVGKGSVFTVRLPLREVLAGRGGRSLLLVDDDAQIRSSVAEWLAQDGFQVRCAATLTQAADCLAQQRFDILLLDMQLGGDSGYLLAELARKQPQRPLMLAMSADPAEFADSRASWFSARLGKPFDGQQLRAALAVLPA
ncbi:ATP-binding protein (plasmid) [Chromobacterium amazonense]|uniref:ATP-binding protein n=1 Tax=Chromobacterium amazonense TaxID=1382803 RepID=UPI00237E00EB|nr:ATP-binding protein [Chromobacterium amazonense]MDE1711372.1 ATP-binding protein [Chromobacterium amazonense]